MNRMRQTPFFSKILKGFVFRNAELLFICIVTKNDLYMIKPTDVQFHIFEGGKEGFSQKFEVAHGSTKHLIIGNPEACVFAGT